jgi:very-short-patch-repair endonuclease
VFHKFIFNIEPLKPRRKSLRTKSTQAEKILWERLRDSKLGYKFFRQYSVEGYVTDFYCPKIRLAVELEGKIHTKADQKLYDKNRFRYLEAFDIKIIRFQNEEIYLHIGDVIENILATLRPPS